MTSNDKQHREFQDHAVEAARYRAAKDAAQTPIPAAE